MEHAATFDLSQFEDPTLYDQLNRARHETVGRVKLICSDHEHGSRCINALVIEWGASRSPSLLLLVVAVLPNFERETVAEHGPHIDRIARGGPYAELFRMQAEAYR
jgi:ATP-binding cassette subfamily B protein